MRFFQIYIFSRNEDVLQNKEVSQMHKNVQKETSQMHIGKEERYGRVQSL